MAGGVMACTRGIVAMRNAVLMAVCARALLRRQLRRKAIENGGSRHALMRSLCRVLVVVMPLQMFVKGGKIACHYAPRGLSAQGWPLAPLDVYGNSVRK